MYTRKLKFLYVTATLREKWGEGEPIVAKNTIESLKSMNYNVTATFYSSKYGNFLTRLFGKWRAVFSSSDSFILSHLYYLIYITKELYVKKTRTL